MSADILDELELMRFTRIDPIRENAILKRAKDEIVRLRGEACSCPSGDGSLRWPCKAHPPESIAPAEANGDLSALERLAWNWKNIDVPIGDVGSSATLERCANELRAVIATMTTPQPAGGEAVAEWQVWHKEDGWGATHPDNVAEYRARGVPVRPLYAHPPAPVQAAPPAAPERAHRPSAEWYRHRITECLDVEEPMAAPQEGEAAYWERWHPTHGVVSVNREPLGESIVDNRWEDRPLYRANPSACELGEDTELLRWLIANELIVHQLKDNGRWMIVAGDMSPAIDGSEHDTPREAIRAALQHRGDSQEVGRV